MHIQNLPPDILRVIYKKYCNRFVLNSELINAPALSLYGGLHYITESEGTYITHIDSNNILTIRNKAYNFVCFRLEKNGKVLFYSEDGNHLEYKKQLIACIILIRRHNFFINGNTKVILQSENYKITRRLYDLLYNKDYHWCENWNDKIKRIILRIYRNIPLF